MPSRTKYIAALLLASLALGAFALPSVDASGRSEDEARARARIELAMALKTEVKAEVYNFASRDGKAEAWTRNLSSSNLVLLGVQQNCQKLAADEFSCKAALDEAAAKPLYRAALAEIRLKLKQGAEGLARSKAAGQAARLREMLAQVDRAEGLALVARMLDGAEPEALPVNRADLQSQLAGLEKDIPDLDLAVSLLAKQLPAGRYFIAAPKTAGSEEVTPFARALQDRLASKLLAVPDLASAQYFLSGQYQGTDKQLFLTWRATPASGADAKVLTQTLNLSATQGLRHEPQQIGLDQLLQSGLLVKGDLRVTLATQAGAVDGQSFVAGNKIKLLAKVNKAGFMYMVSHVTDAACKQYSYLVQLNDLPAGSPESKRAFMRVISPDEANRFVEIGEFTVTPPFGVERMQVIASNQDLLADIPDFRWGGEANDLALVAQQAGKKLANGNCQWADLAPVKAVAVRTRALSRVKPSAEKAESTFTFTTLPR